MRILHVIHSVDPRSGGTIEGLKQISAALVQQGEEVDVLSLDDPSTAWVRDFPLTLHAMGPSRGNYGYSRQVVPWLIKNGPAYDAILVNGLWQFGSFATWLASRKAALRYYVFPHGMLDPWFAEHYPFKHLKKWFYWPWAEYRVLRDARAVIFTSEEEQIQARRSFWLYRCREEVLGYGIAAPSLAPETQKAAFLTRFPELSSRRCFLFLGRLHEKKGCDLLLKAFQKICHEKKNADLQLVMAGPCDDVYGNRMEELGQSLGISDRLTWTGMLTGEIKWGAFQAADVFVLPSHQENFGVSVVEALACGLPVLISNKVNIWREVEAGQAGLVEADDLAGTTRLLDRWLALSDSQRREMRTRSTVVYASYFQSFQVAMRLRALLTR